MTDILTANGVDEPSLLRAAAGVEAGSAHPLAIAVLQAAEVRGIRPPRATSASAVPGKAATAMIDGVQVTVGSPGYAASQGADLAAFAGQIQAFEEEGKTAVVVMSETPRARRARVA